MTADLRLRILTLCTLAAVPNGLVAQGPARVELQPDATAPEAFTRIRGLVEISDGRILVADQTEDAVYLASFTEPGKVKLGRNGKGPLEYERPTGLFAVAGDTALIYDLFNARFQVVTAEGTTGTVAISQLGPAGTIPHSLDRQRRLYWDGVVASRLAKRDQPGSRLASWGALLRGSPEGVDTLAYLHVPGPANPGPVPEWDRWDSGPDGWVAIVRNQDSYRVDWVGPDGSQVEGREVEERRAEISRAERAELEAAPAAGAMSGSGGARGRPAARHVPDRFPYALSVRVSPSREAWVERALPSDQPGPAFDVFSSAGERIALYRLPEGRKLIGFGPRTVYATREDDVGLLWVERYPYPDHR